SHRFSAWFRFPVRHPGQVLVAALILGLAGFLLWLGGRVAWCRWDRARAERALAEYDFTEARQAAAECIRLQPHHPAIRLLAARAARPDGDLQEAGEQLDPCARRT